MLLIVRYCPIADTPAEPLWREGEASYVESGRADRGVVTTAPFDLVAWVAMLDDEPAAIQACRVRGAEAHGVLSWCRPAFRRRGLFRAIQRQVDADLLDMDVTAIRSWVVDGPDAYAMAAAIETRGGAKVGERMVDGLAGPVRWDEYLRPLRRG